MSIEMIDRWNQKPSLAANMSALNEAMHVTEEQWKEEVVIPPTDEYELYYVENGSGAGYLVDQYVSLKEGCVVVKHFSESFTAKPFRPETEPIQVKRVTIPKAYYMQAMSDPIHNAAPDVILNTSFAVQIPEEEQGRWVELLQEMKEPEEDTFLQMCRFSELFARTEMALSREQDLEGAVEKETRKEVSLKTADHTSHSWKNHLKRIKKRIQKALLRI